MRSAAPRCLPSAASAEEARSSVPSCIWSLVPAPRSEDIPAHGRVSEGGRLDNDPSENSLRLLPSGPDRVGEAPVHRQPPGAVYGPDRQPMQLDSGYEKAKKIKASA